MSRHVLVAGAGSIARRHIANVRTLDPDARITVLRRAPGSGDDELRASGLEVHHRWGDVPLASVTAAIVASPAPTHVGLAHRLTEAGVPMLVEKPLADTLDGVAALLEACDARGVVLMVGYNLRFKASLQRLRTEVRDGTIGTVQFARAEVGQYLPDWRPASDYRSSVTARRALGGGALLELSHEVDYLRWLLGEVVDVRAWTGRLGDLDIDVEDTAELVLRFASGPTASVHLDLLRRVPARWCRVDGSEGSLVWDGIGSTIDLLVAGAPPRRLELPRDEPGGEYLAELAHFFACVDGRATPAVDGHDAAKTLAVVLAATRAAEMPGVSP